MPLLKGFAKDGHPKPLIETIAEDLLATFQTAPLLDAYDVYQHLMDYWAETMQDDCYLIADDGWREAAQPRAIVEVKNKEDKLSGPTSTTSRRQAPVQVRPRPAALLIARYFAAEQAMPSTRSKPRLAGSSSSSTKRAEEQSGEEGLLAEVDRSEGEKQKNHRQKP